jgi:hypothetical protein
MISLYLAWVLLKNINPMTSINPELVPEINQSLEINLPVSISIDELRQKLTAYVNNLINHDFEKLVYYLYRIDVNETKMRQLLAQKEGENAAGLITDLIIERQMQKIKSRRDFRQRDNDINEEDRW